MQENLKSYVFELEVNLTTLVDSVANKPETSVDLCDRAQGSCSRAARLFSKDSISMTELLRALAPTIELLKSSPAIYESNNRETQESYETCVCLLSMIENETIPLGISFRKLGILEEGFQHPFIEDMQPILERILESLKENI